MYVEPGSSACWLHDGWGNILNPVLWILRIPWASDSIGRDNQCGRNYISPFSLYTMMCHGWIPLPSFLDMIQPPLWGTRQTDVFENWFFVQWADVFWRLPWCLLESRIETVTKREKVKALVKNTLETTGPGRITIYRFWCSSCSHSVLRKGAALRIPTTSHPISMVRPQNQQSVWSKGH